MTCLKEEECGERGRRRGEASQERRKIKSLRRRRTWDVGRRAGEGVTTSPLPRFELSFCRWPKWAGHPLRVLMHFEYSGKIWVVFILKSHGWFSFSHGLLSVSCMHEGVICTKGAMWDWTQGPVSSSREWMSHRSLLVLPEVNLPLNSLQASLSLHWWNAYFKYCLWRKAFSAWICMGFRIQQTWFTVWPFLFWAVWSLTGYLTSLG